MSDDEEPDRDALAAALESDNGGEYLEALSDRVGEMEEDDTVDFDSEQRQDEGWLKFYVECPDCHVPMARTTVVSEDGGQVGDVRRSTSELRAICPECKEVMTVLEITRKTGPFGDLS